MLSYRACDNSTHSRWSGNGVTNVVALLLLTTSFVESGATPLSGNLSDIKSRLWPSNPRQWESAIRAFEADDCFHHQNRTIFYGSSTIRLWTTLEQDYPDLSVLRRGFGGSQIPDATYFAGRVIAPCAPRQVVIFSGSNDIAVGRTPSQVVDEFRLLVSTLRSLVPTARLSFIEITSSPRRLSRRSRVESANAMIQQHCAASGVDFIPAHHLFLTPPPRDVPNQELFQKDMLHLNRKGYELLAQAVRPYLSPPVNVLPLGASTEYHAWLETENIDSD
jgi:lysophospholipase L1-like esterase